MQNLLRDIDGQAADSLAAGLILPAADQLQVHVFVGVPAAFHVAGNAFFEIGRAHDSLLWGGMDPSQNWLLEQSMS